MLSWFNDVENNPSKGVKDNGHIEKLKRQRHNFDANNFSYALEYYML